MKIVRSNNTSATKKSLFDHLAEGTNLNDICPTLLAFVTEVADHIPQNLREGKFSAGEEKLGYYAIGLIGTNYGPEVSRRRARLILERAMLYARSGVTAKAVSIDRSVIDAIYDGNVDAVRLVVQSMLMGLKWDGSLRKARVDTMLNSWLYDACHLEQDISDRYHVPSKNATVRSSF